MTGPVPASIDAALRESFSLLETPGGADGVLATLPTRVDDAFLDGVGPQLRIVAN